MTDPTALDCETIEAIVAGVVGPAKAYIAEQIAALEHEL